MMKLARLIYRDGISWYLPDGSRINPDIGTVVQGERKTYGTVSSYVIYFPGIAVGKPVLDGVFSRYFEFL